MWFIIRHAQTLENSLGIQQGQMESLLSLKGIVQSQSIAYRLLDFKDEDYNNYDFISSPLPRTRHTLQIIMEVLNVVNKKPILEPLLSSRNKGIFQGLEKDKIKEIYPEEYAKMQKDMWNYIPPEATESKNDTYNRIKEFIEKYKDHKNVILVTHGSITKMIKQELLDMKFQGSESSNNNFTKSQNYFYCWDGDKMEKI